MKNQNHQQYNNICKFLKQIEKEKLDLQSQLASQTHCYDAKKLEIEKLQKELKQLKERYGSAIKALSQCSSGKLDENSFDFDKNSSESKGLLIDVSSQSTDSESDVDLKRPSSVNNLLQADGDKGIDLASFKKEDGQPRDKPCASVYDANFDSSGI